MNIAHYFTFFRIFVSPVFLLVYIAHKQIGISETALPLVLIFLLAMSEFSDAFDGYIARKRNEVSELGKILDPMADSIYRNSVFLTFTLEPIQVPMILIFVFIYRDSVISTLRTICAMRGFTLAARVTGKIKAIIQAIAAFSILALMIPHSFGIITTHTLQSISTWIVGITAAFVFLSGIEYLFANRIYIMRLLSSHEKHV